MAWGGDEDRRPDAEEEEELDEAVRNGFTLKG